MRTFFIFAFLSSLLTSSCNYEKYKNATGANKGTYWDVFDDPRQPSALPLYSLFCGVNGECIYYTYTKLPDGGLKRIRSEDGSDINTWSMKDDTIYLRGKTYFLYLKTNEKLKLISTGLPKDTLQPIQSNTGDHGYQMRK